MSIKSIRFLAAIAALSSLAACASAPDPSLAGEPLCTEFRSVKTKDKYKERMNAFIRPKRPCTTEEARR